VSSGFPVLSLMATLKAARDFGLDQRSLDAIALQFDPRHPDIDLVAGELAAALCRRTGVIPDAM
jgi:hypothetical protein